MIRLAATTQKLQAVLGGAVSTNQLPITVCFSDKTASAYTGGVQVSATNGASDVDICAAPAASTIRDIDYISARNADTATATLTFKIDISATDTVIRVFTLAVGDQVEYTHGSGWKVLDSEGNTKTGAGVDGPTTSTDNAIARFDGTTGQFIQNSGVTIDDSNNMVVAGNLGLGTTAAFANINKGIEIETASSAAGIRLERITTGALVFEIYTDSDALRMRTLGADTLHIGTNNTDAINITTGQALQFPAIGTTASAANAFLDSGASNNLLRSTSSLYYKDVIEDISLERAKRILSLRPIRYRSKAKADNPEWSYYGLGAEDVAVIDPRLVNWGYQPDDYETVCDENGAESVVLKSGAIKKPDGVMYDRISVMMLPLISDHERRLAALEAKLQ